MHWTSGWDRLGTSSSAAPENICGGYVGSLRAKKTDFVPRRIVALFRPMWAPRHEIRRCGWGPMLEEDDARRYRNSADALIRNGGEGRWPHRFTAVVRPARQAVDTTASSAFAVHQSIRCRRQNLHSAKLRRGAVWRAFRPQITGETGLQARNGRALRARAATL